MARFAEAAPGAQTPGGDPDAAPGVAAHTGHSDFPPPSTVDARAIARRPACCPASSRKRESQRSAAASGGMGLMVRRSGGKGNPPAPTREVAALGGVGHAGDEAQHFGPLFRRLRVEPCGLAHRPVDISRRAFWRVPLALADAGSATAPSSSPSQAARAEASSACKCKGTAILVSDAVQRLDLL